MSNDVFIVYGVMADGRRHALLAFATEAAAKRHAERCLAEPLDEEGWPGRSAASILGLRTVVIDRLEVLP